MSIFSPTYLYLPLFTYIWLYLGLITLIWAYLPLIALILPHVPYSPYNFICILLLRVHLCDFFRAIGPFFMEILYFKDLADTSVVSECSLGVNLVIDNFLCSFRYFTSIKFESNRTITLIWRYCILKIWGIRVLFGCERSCSSARRVSNFNSKVPQGGIYPHIKFERDRLNIFLVKFTSSGSTGGLGGDAKIIISPNTSFGDIIMKLWSFIHLSVYEGRLSFLTCSRNKYRQPVS